MGMDVDQLMNMWLIAGSHPQQRELSRQRTDDLAKKLAKTSNEKKLREAAVKMIQAINPEMEAKLIRWMSGDMAAKGVRGFESQSNFYYSIKRLVASLQAPAKPSNLLISAAQAPLQLFGKNSGRDHPEIRFCSTKLSQLVKQAWQVQEFPVLEQARTWFDRFPSHLLPSLGYFPKQEWLEKACLHPGYQQQMIAAVNSSQVNLADLGITSSRTLEAFVKLYGRQLTTLDLSCCPFLSESDIVCIISLVPALQHLSLATLNLSDAAIQIFAKSYPSLKSLQLDDTEVSDETLKLFVNPNITNLSLIQCRQISGAALAHAASTCPQLKSLKLAGLLGTVVNEFVLCEFAKHCPLLHLPLDIDLERLKQLPLHMWHHHWRSSNALRDHLMRRAFIQVMNTDREPPSLAALEIKDRQQLKEFLKECSKELKNINLKGCDFLEDDDLAEIAEAIPELENLALKGSPRLTDACLTRMADKWGNVTALYLSDCPEISIRAIFHFVTHHPKISTLCCPKVPYDVLLILAQECPELKNIGITKENGSSEEYKIFKAKLTKINPNIKVTRSF